MKSVKELLTKWIIDALRRRKREKRDAKRTYKMGMQRDKKREGDMGMK